MSRYALEEVVQKWAKEELTVEQAIGQLFLHIENVIERLNFLEKKETLIEFSLKTKLFELLQLISFSTAFNIKRKYTKKQH